MLNHDGAKRIEQINFKIDGYYKRKPMEELFANPIVKVDVHSGAVIIDRLREVWESESTEYIAFSKN